MILNDPSLQEAAKACKVQLICEILDVDIINEKLNQAKEACGKVNTMAIDNTLEALDKIKQIKENLPK